MIFNLGFIPVNYSHLIKSITGEPTEPGSLLFTVNSLQIVIAKDSAFKSFNEVSNLLEVWLQRILFVKIINIADGFIGCINHFKNAEVAGMNIMLTYQFIFHPVN